MQEPVPLWQDARWLVATGMAAAGLLLSIYNHWMQYRLRHPKIRMLLQDAIAKKHKVAYAIDEDPYYGTEHLLTITIKNYGHVDLTFEKNCCELEVKGVPGSVPVRPRQTQPDLPATIKHGQNIKLVARAAGVDRPLRQLSDSPKRRIRVIAKDAIGRRFYGSWRDLEITKDTTDDDE